MTPERPHFSRDQQLIREHVSREDILDDSRAEGQSRPALRPPEVTIRDVEDGDLRRIAEIFAEVVTTTHFSFVLEPPDLGSWRQQVSVMDRRDGFLVATAGQQGVVCGFAYSSAFRPRPAYDGCRATTIYLAPAARGAGVGGLLYAALLDRLTALGNRLAIGVVADPNPASEALHRRLGFERAGTLPEVGEKFGRLWSTTYWVRRLT